MKLRRFYGQIGRPPLLPLPEPDAFPPPGLAWWRGRGAARELTGGFLAAAEGARLNFERGQSEARRAWASESLETGASRASSFTWVRVLQEVLDQTTRASPRQL
eukprot:3274347-Pyramimonas_sp.AAC.1